MTGRVVRLLVGLVIGLAGTAVTAAPALAVDSAGAAAPALAHGADAPAGTDFRSSVVGFRPAVPGLRARAIEAGARLELTNHTGRTIEVLGYAGEPYLEIRPDGVYENAGSPAAYTNRTLAGDTPVPAEADPASPPRWRKVAEEPVARWHDQRARWVGAGLPDPVRADPGRPHRVADWVVPLRDGTRNVDLRGTLDWLPPPSPGRWWLAGLIGAGLIGLLGAVGTPGLRGTPAPPGTPSRHPLDLAGEHGTTGGQGTTGGGRDTTDGQGRASGRGPARVALAALCAVAGLGAIALAVGRVADGTADGLPAVLAGLFTGPRWATLSGLGALVVAGYAMTRRSAAGFGFALTGVCVGTFAGVANGAAFANSVVPSVWPAPAYRWLVLAMVVLGYGVALAGVLRLRAARLSAATAPASDQRGDDQRGNGDDQRGNGDDQRGDAGDQRGPAPATRGSKP
ncbi:hypothetical protein [Plantactinospora sp. GCM10030261]|uniref:hypothetical protein n=1 Tax=Plantactinospora sp. GCM10030261 TaxID=3273420 RepID=UPI003612B8C0